MADIINVITKIIFIFFIITSILFGFSLSINILIKHIIKKITNESKSNFNKLSKDERNECEIIILKFKKDINEYNNINKENIKITNKNKIRRLLKKQQISKIENPYNFKKLIISQIKALSSPFFGDSNLYLRFSEREVFTVINSLLIRIRKIIDASGIIWLKKIKISFFLMIFDLYGKYSQIKNAKLVYVILKIISFFSIIYRFLSPVSSFKYLVKNIKNQGFIEMITDAVIEIISYELAVIYKEKSITNII